MSLVFYYSPLSSAVTVHWALEELGVPYEKVRIDLKARDQDKPGYRALNPNGKVPLIVHDGTPIFESVAIMLHLGETFGVDKKLFPRPGIQRAEVTQWMVWSHVSLGGSIALYQRTSSPNVPAEQHNPATAAAAKAEVETLMGILDKQLEKKTWLVGESFSFADLHVASWVSYLGMLGFDPTRWANVDAWRKRSTARPGYGVSMAQ